jgi:hypothetical protein
MWSSELLQWWLTGLILPEDIQNVLADELIKAMKAPADGRDCAAIVGLISVRNHEPKSFTPALGSLDRSHGSRLDACAAASASADAPA